MCRRDAADQDCHMPRFLGRASPRDAMSVVRRLWSLALLMCACAAATPCASEEPKSGTHIVSPVASVGDVRRRFIHGAFALIERNGVILGKRWVGSDEPPPLAETSVVDALAGHSLSDQDVAALWEMFAGDAHAPLVTVPLLKSAIEATGSFNRTAHSRLTVVCQVKSKFLNHLKASTMEHPAFLQDERLQA